MQAAASQLCVRIHLRLRTIVHGALQKKKVKSQRRRHQKRLTCTLATQPIKQMRLQRSQFYKDA